MPPTSKPLSSAPVASCRRILIVEEALHTLKGHWFEYIKTIATACRDSGDEVTIVAHREADEKVIKELNAEPLLPRNAWDRSNDSPNPFRRYGEVLSHNWHLYRSVARILRRRQKWTCVLAPTILIHHLIAWTFLAYIYRRRRFDRLVLIFINSQGIYQGTGRSAKFPRHPKTALFRFLLRRLRPLIDSGHVVLAAETDGMAKEFQLFSGVPFQRFAHPVEFHFRLGVRKSNSAKPLTFACFGFARHEKGSDLLQEAILELRKRRPDLRIRFIIQWLDDFTRPDGSLVTRSPQLQSDRDVTFIDHAFDEVAYLQFLAETDAMILPYRARSYYARVSRVAIEAAICGIPIVYTEKTWLEEMVVCCGSGIGFEDENLEQLIASIIRMAEEIDVWRHRAKERSGTAQEVHAARNYRASLLGKAQRLTGETGPAPGNPRFSEAPSH